jgi:hypothetical protein
MNLIQLFLYFIIYLFIICLPQLNNLSYAIDYNSSTTQIKGSNSSFGTLPFNEVKVMFLDMINTLQDINSELNNHSSAIDYLRIVIPSTHNNSTSNKLINSQTNNTNLTITIRTDKSKYYNDEDITIFGKVYDNNLKLTNTVLSVTPIFNETSFFSSFLSSSHETKQSLILQKTEIPVIDGIYNFTLYLSKQGLYNISISDKSGNNERFLIVEAKNKFFSYTFILIYLIIILIILYGLFTWFAIKGKSSSKNPIYRFFIWLKRLKRKPKEQRDIYNPKIITTTPKDKPVEVTLGGSNIDQGDDLTTKIDKKPLYGQLSEINQTTGKVTYTPNPNFVGEDVFTFKIKDKQGQYINYVGTVWISVQQLPNQPPPSDQSPTKNRQTPSANKLSSGENKDEESIDISYKFKYEVLRFFILSAISITPLVSFMLMDVEIGKFSPIGLVMKNIENATDVQQDIISKEWVINIGGSVSDNYSKGITIPFYVFAFGWMGGYLRYLYRVVIKIPFLLDHPDELNTALWLYLRNPRNIRYKDRRYKDLNLLPLFIYASFEELAEILLAPLLAIAVWFLLNIFDPTLDIFTVSLISFTVGLITRDVVKRLIDYSMKTIGGSTNETSSNRSNNEPTEYIK